MNVASRHQPPSSVAREGSSPGSRGRPSVGSVPDSPPASRAPRRTWRDPRLLLGVVIVAVCVLVGARLFASADDTVAVWAVRSDLSAGAGVTVADLERRSLRFGSPDLAGRYLSADEQPPGGLMVTRDVSAGELLPRAALAPADRTELLEVPVAAPAEGVPGTLRAGEVVDVWVTPDAETGGDVRAVPVLEGVRVVAVPSTGSALGPSATRQVLVGVPADQRGRLSSALAQLSTGTPVVVRRG